MTIARHSIVFGVCSLGLTLLATMASERAASAGPDTNTVASLYGADTNRAGAADWFPEAWKATCASSEAVTGISQATTQAYVKSALCSTQAGLTAGASVTLNVTAENRRAKRIADWDHDFYKAECALNEYVSGVAQSPSTSNAAFKGIRCTAAPPGVSYASNCETHVAGTDDRGTQAVGDWEHGFYKTECAAGKVVVGASKSTTTDKFHRILCCGR
jgi:hypothetical protein